MISQYPQQRITPKIITPTGYIKNGFKGMIVNSQCGKNAQSKTGQPKTDADRRNDFFANQQIKKFRRGMTRLVLLGVQRDCDIYHRLCKKGYATNPDGGKLYSKGTLQRTIKYIREKYGMPARDKQTQVLMLHKAGHTKSEICEMVPTRMSYLRELEREYKIKIRISRPRNERKVNK
ncbi:MAG: hypothetical protein EBU46_01390 [Nitrosomonadaceae bacterium]|nr:hypothetical protein [Nitrosomonadaceae bacterium]